MKKNLTEILGWNLEKVSHLIKNKDISPVELVEAALQRIDEVNPKLNAFITILHDQALKQAKVMEQELVQGKWRGPLHGIPVGLKDLIYTKGIRTTMASGIYKDYIPEYSATVAESLERAGTVLLGKLNTHEFAYGPSGDVSYFGPVRNPYDLNRITGGSSSGSGAAVSTGMCFAALGTDTGGSVRIPSSACGIIGMKPTFGRVSKHGVYPLGYTLDHVGPMTRSVKDNAMLLNLLAGYDPNDPYSLEQSAEDFTRQLGMDISGLVIGRPDSYFYDHLEDEVREALDRAGQVFERLGASVREVQIDLSQAAWAQLITVRGESYAIHENHMDANLDELQPEVRSRLEASKDTSAYEYVKAQQERLKIRQSFLDALRQVDVILAPTLAILPPVIGQRESNINGHIEPTFASLLRLNGPANSTGLPSLSMPCGLSKNGLPIGMQLIGKPLDEATIYRFASAFEEEEQFSTLKWEI
ncbi:amidase [Ammoniphilus sp. CFH 90114]|uniref:amidase n=1 Tax=Ammoniphilus sp. CFH 90114 TaxID=2493665 RepID=UPI00100FDE59|nr:amidase [Ammoniphilus sp. CFH 90114]RXT02326.1 amidase [Ammoniphilus sp. CFH 90114]